VENVLVVALVTYEVMEIVVFAGRGRACGIVKLNDGKLSPPGNPPPSPCLFDTDIHERPAAVSIFPTSQSSSASVKRSCVKPRTSVEACTAHGGRITMKLEKERTTAIQV